MVLHPAPLILLPGVASGLVMTLFPGLGYSKSSPSAVLHEVSGTLATNISGRVERAVETLLVEALEAPLPTWTGAQFM